MTREEVVEHLCRTVSIVYRSIGDYEKPSDGFCSSCFQHRTDAWNFQHSGETLEFVRAAVIEKLHRDGFTIREEASQ